MRKYRSRFSTAVPAFAAAVLMAALMYGCATIPIKQYYMLNYLPSTQADRLSPAPYPCTIRLRDFSIEEAYNRPQIVYRQSPFELQYYVYRVWAVKPARMVTDLVYKHLTTRNLVSSVIRRFDEGPKPDYELSGVIEALEEYDSEELWFAHLAIRMNLVRISDGQSVYTRRFDIRKRVYKHSPENVIRELSALMEFIMTQAAHDIDRQFSKEYGVPSNTGTGTGQERQETGDNVEEIK
jgi:ABC-type uncharacterized transport system auxiliary subunit